MTVPAERAFCNNTIGTAFLSTITSGTWSAAVTSGDLVVAIVTTRTAGITSHSLSTTGFNAWTAALPIYQHTSSANFKTSIWWTTTNTGLASGLAGPIATFNAGTCASIQCIAYSGANSTAISSPSGSSPFLLMLQGDDAFMRVANAVGRRIFQTTSTGSVTGFSGNYSINARIDGYPSVLMTPAGVLENPSGGLAMTGPLGSTTIRSTTSTTSAPRIGTVTEGSTTSTTGSATVSSVAISAIWTTSRAALLFIFGIVPSLETTTGNAFQKASLTDAVSALTDTAAAPVIPTLSLLESLTNLADTATASSNFEALALTDALSGLTTTASASSNLSSLTLSGVISSLANSGTVALSPAPLATSQAITSLSVSALGAITLAKLNLALATGNVTVQVISFNDATYLVTGTETTFSGSGDQVSYIAPAGMENEVTFNGLGSQTVYLAETVDGSFGV